MITAESLSVWRSAVLLDTFGFTVFTQFYTLQRHHPKFGYLYHFLWLAVLPSFALCTSAAPTYSAHRAVFISLMQRIFISYSSYMRQSEKKPHVNMGVGKEKRGKSMTENSRSTQGQLWVRILQMGGIQGGSRGWLCWSLFLLTVDCCDSIVRQWN